jgi:hypothetical protein
MPYNVSRTGTAVAVLFETGHDWNCNRGTGMALDPREQLRVQIRTLRARIDPDVLARAEQAAQAADAARTAKASAGPVSLPFDKDNARTAVQMFLQSRNDGGAFASKVMRMMEAAPKPEQAAKAYQPKAPPKPKPGFLKRLFS